VATATSTAHRKSQTIAVARDQHVWLVAASKTNKDIDIVDFLDDSEIEELPLTSKPSLMKNRLIR